MDISKISQLNSYDTAIDESISIYLSFDSSTADKTVEAEENFFEREEDRENQGTVIKRSIEMTPVRKASKTILQEINVFSSTPTQKGGVDQIQLGMAALGLAPLGEVSGEGKMNRAPNLSTICEKTLETSSKQKGSEDCDWDKTIEDKKSANVVTVSSSSDSDSSSALSIIVIEADSDNSPRKSMKDDENKENICEKNSSAESSIQIFEIEKSLEDKDIEKIKGLIPPVINTLNQGNKENVCKANLTEIGDGNKPNSGAIPKLRMGSPYDSKVEVPAPKRMSTFRMRKSLMPCEPDLNLNRPSRIETGNKRLSTNSSKRTSTLPTITSIPRLLLKAIGEIPPTRPSSLQEKEDDPKKTHFKRNSMIPPPPKPKSIDLGKRQTLFASPSNKRQTIFAVPSTNKRFAVIKQKTSSVAELSPRGLPKKSGILKTTLNSSAATRRSIRKSLSTPIGSISKLSRNSLLPPSVKPLNSLKARSRSPKEANKNQAIDPKPQQVKSAVPSSSDVFCCDKCPRIFRLSSSLEAHKVLHGVTSITAPICKFCDKKFAISKALTNHLLEKCTKIPTSERKKLLFPPRTSQNNDRSKGGNSSATFGNKLGIPRHSHQPGHQIALEITAPDSKKMHPPTSVTKNKGKVPPAHSGVYRTPNKPVACYPCKKNFDHGLGFTEHLVICHSGSEVDTSEEI